MGGAVNVSWLVAPRFDARLQYSVSKLALGMYSAAFETPPGVPPGVPGTTNGMRVHKIGSAGPGGGV